MAFLTGTDSITIPVADLKRAIRWYADTLGATPSDYATETLCPLEFPRYSGPVVELVKADGSTRLSLSEPNGRPMAAFSFACNNARKMYERVAKQGAKIHELHEDEDDDEKCSFVFEDPDGNVLAITDILWS